MGGCVDLAWEVSVSIMTFFLLFIRFLPVLGDCRRSKPSCQQQTHHKLHVDTENKDEEDRMTDVNRFTM